MMRWFEDYWRELARSLLGTFGAIFLVLEAFEVLVDGNIKVPFVLFLVIGVLPGLAYFFLDGYCFSGFLRRAVVIPNPGSDTKVTVKFGDLFQEPGWKAIGVNDFFDSNVDEDLVSSRSLHGYALTTFWRDNRGDWQRQIKESLLGKQASRESRSKGNRRRYPIGTTARACTDKHKFLFVALGQTDSANNVASANAESLIRAVRGMVAEARAACSMEPLAIPLIQRNGEIYEFLTNEEKDVEAEIKSLDVDPTEITKELETLAFDTILRHRKIKHLGTGYEYAFSRKLDDHLLGRDYELSINIISPFNDDASAPDAVRMRNMGREELAIVLTPCASLSWMNPRSMMSRK